MTFRRATPLLVLTILVLGSLFFSPIGASEENRVALVIDYGDGEVITQCVTFPEDSITGYEALQRSELPVETDFQTGGAAVCRIDGQGCPAEDCFCSCRGGGDCKYWSYWHLTNGVWGYSAAGAGIYNVQDGMVDGWVWGLGSVTQASPPPVIPFGEICTDGSVDTPTVTPTASLTPTPVILPTAVPVDVEPVVTITRQATATMQFSTPTPGFDPSITITPNNESLPIETPSIGSTSIPSVRTTQPVGESTSTPTGLQGLPVDGPSQSDEPRTDQVIPLAGLQTATTPEYIVETNQEFLIAEESAANDEESSANGNIVGTSPLVLESPPTPTQVQIAAIIGKDVMLEETSSPRSPMVKNESVIDWRPYAGYAGLILFLCALAILVHHRRGKTLERRDQ